jgi:pimeloyl-ACP methyl ester carboxylesterase
LALALLGLGAGAWHFSNEIYDGSFKAEEPDPDAPPNPDYAYPTEPTTALGFRAREVTFENELGAFPAWYAEGRRPDRRTWVILVHGRGAPRTETFRAAAIAHGAGYPVLSITYRNDAGAPDDPNDEYSFGQREWRDLEAAVRYAVDEGADRVVLGGFSMGAAIATNFLLRSELKERVVGLVLDSPAIDLEAAVDEGASHRSLPVIGLPLPDILVSSAKALAALRFDIDWERLDYVEEVARLDVPTLVIHGMADETVPVSVSERLKAYKPAVQLERFQGADHVESWNADRRRYASVLTDFLAAVTR